MTIFLTTQYLEEADRLAEQVAIINHGSIVARGAPAELKKGLGDEVVELTLATAEPAARADAALASLAPNRQLSGRKLRLYFADAAHALPEVVRRLDAAQVGFSGLTVSQPTLDDVFLRVTGELLGNQEPAGEEGTGVTAAVPGGSAAAAAGEKVSA